MRSIFFFLLFAWCWGVTVDMARSDPYAKVVGGKVVTIEDKTNPETALDGSGNPIWRPFVQESQPAFDPATQVIERSETIAPTQVTRGWTVRAKTQAELDADAAEQEAEKLSRLNVFIKVLCRLENHDRASDGKVAWTETQCRDALKGMMN